MQIATGNMIQSLSVIVSLSVFLCLEGRRDFFVNRLMKSWRIEEVKASGGEVYCQAVKNKGLEQRLKNYSPKKEKMML